MVKIDIKVPKRRVYLETDIVERGKPRERETQNMVGESSNENLNQMKNDLFIDKCLPPLWYKTWLIKIIINI